MIHSVSIPFLPPLPLLMLFSPPSHPLTSSSSPSTAAATAGFLTATGSGDGVRVCVLLFVMKMGFRQMDGEILEEKCNLKESSTEKDGLLSLQTSSPPDGGVVRFYFVCM